MTVRERVPRTTGAGRIPAIVLLLMNACGRNGFEPMPDTSQIGDASNSDAVLDTPQSCALGVFSAPVQLPGPVNSSVDDWTPSISASDLTLLFYSQRSSSPGEPDVWISKRTSAGASFPAATVLVEVSSPARETFPRMTADELELWFVSDRAGTTMEDIYVATRASPAAPFGTPTRVAALSSNSADDSLWVSGDGLRIMFSSNRGASVDLYSASRSDRSASWSTPTVVTELTTGAVDASPALSSDELEIFFISNRAGGVGKFDIWYAKRPDRNDPFSTPTNVPILSSTEDEWGLSLSADGRHLYYSYSSSLAGGNADIWVATRPCE